MSLFVEWGSWEVNALFVAHFGDVPLAAHAVLQLTSGTWSYFVLNDVVLILSAALWYAIPLGVSMSASALVGNALGAHKPKDAKTITMCVITSSQSNKLLQFLRFTARDIAAFISALNWLVFCLFCIIFFSYV